MRAEGERSQAAVELALVLPLVAVLLLLVVQVALVVRDQVLVVHAAREAARQAAVDPAPGAPRRAAVAAAPLDPERLAVEVTRPIGGGGRAQVTVSYRLRPFAPVFAPLMTGRVATGRASMRVED